jgi:hypothetical protein
MKVIPKSIRKEVRDSILHMKDGTGEHADLYVQNIRKYAARYECSIEEFGTNEKELDNFIKKNAIRKAVDMISRITNGSEHKKVYSVYLKDDLEKAGIDINGVWKYVGNIGIKLKEFRAMYEKLLRQ